MTHEQISSKAREIWEREGRPEGRDMEHWLKAESELRQQSPTQPTEHALSAKNTENGSAAAASSSLSHRETATPRRRSNRRAK